MDSGFVVVDSRFPQVNFAGLQDPLHIGRLTGRKLCIYKIPRLESLQNAQRRQIVHRKHAYINFENCANMCVSEPTFTIMSIKQCLKQYLVIFCEIV